MNSKVPEKEWAKAIEVMIELLKPRMTEEDWDNLTKQHPVISEIDEFSWKGPIDIGQRRHGGHAIG